MPSGSTAHVHSIGCYTTTLLKPTRSLTPPPPSCPAPRYQDAEVQRDKKLMSYDIVDRQGKPYVQVTVNGEDRTFSPEEVGAGWGGWWGAGPIRACLPMMLATVREKH